MSQVEPPPFLQDIAMAFNSYLEGFLKNLLRGDSPVNEPVAYAMLGEGKRVRPVLACLTAKLLGADERLGLQVGLPLEFVHTYSLVHDDLPCMDDDSVRRGRPTLHVKYDEATALLVGDALLTDAFGILAGSYDDQLPETPLPIAPERRLAMVDHLSRASGSLGMVKGQALDMYWQDRAGGTADDLKAIHLHKTGCLFTASCVLAAIAAGGDDEQVAAMSTIGADIGLLFQIVDDVIDELDGTGKSKSKDRYQNKLTYISIMGKDKSLAKVAELEESLIVALKELGPNHGQFTDFIRFLAGRCR